MWQRVKAIGRWCVDAVLFVCRACGGVWGRLRSTSIGSGVAPLVCWVLLLLCGTWFPSTSILKHFFEGGPLPANFETASQWLTAGLFLVAIASWTWTNLAGICLASAYLGIAARPTSSENDERTAWADVLPRAFVVYLACLFQEIVLSGGLIPSDAKLSSGDAQQHYVRLAVISSLVCFATAFRPALFDKLMENVFGQVPSLKDVGSRQIEFKMEAKERIIAVQPNGDTPAAATLSGPKG
jgi:hypothetical protein